MAELHVQSKVAMTSPNPQTQTPRWGKRLLENMKLAGAATVLAGTLALSACGAVQVEPVVPIKARNPVCDAKLGVIYSRPDGMDSILSRPTDCGQDIYCPYTIPVIALAIFYNNETGAP